MLRFNVLMAVLFIGQQAGSQPLLHWANAFNDHSVQNYRTSSNGRTVGVDRQGNVYSAGLFQHTVDFDPGPGVFTLTGGDTDEFGIYISKVDADGNFVWVRQLPILLEFGDIELKVDPNGNIYLASTFSGPTDMDPGPGILMVTPTGGQDAFIIKLDTDGNLVWAKEFDGPGETLPYATVLDLDQENNVIVCGGFNNTVDFDPGPNTYNLTSTANFQAYVAKLSSNGDLIWAKQFANSQSIYTSADIRDVKCDGQGNIYIVGGFAGTCDFDPGAAVYGLTSTSLRDGFIGKLDANGDFIWAKRIGNTDDYDNNWNLEIRGIAIDSRNNVVATGWFIGTYDFDPGTSEHNVSSFYGYDSYILKITEQGDFSWVKVIGSGDMDTGNDVEVDNADNVYMIGYFGRSVDFDPGPGSFIINSPFYGPAALVKLDPYGNFIYAGAFQNITSGEALFRRMAIDPARNIYITGHIGGSVDFDPGPNIYPLASSSDGSPFVVKLGPCHETAATLNINTCNSYVLNNEIFDSSGIYMRSMPNSFGCDSVITLNLTINRKLTQQTKTICEGASIFAGGASQTETGIYIDSLLTWQGCDSIVTTNLIVNPKPLPDLGPDKDLCGDTQFEITPGSFETYLWQDMSTANSFTVKGTGVYWIRVTNSFNCVSTDTFTVRSLLMVPANFLKESDSICAYQKLDLVPLSAYTDYLWSTGETASTITVENPGMYRLTVTDGNGCSGADTITIYPKDCASGVYVPSAFTPNGDGKNEFFKAVVFGNVLSFRLQVYDRAGQIVFETKDPNKYWDGRKNGLQYSTGVYVWLCSYQLEGQQPGFQKGTLTLIR